MATSSVASAAGSGSIFQPLPTNTFTGPNAGVYAEKQNQAQLAYQQAMADLLQKKNTAYNAYGLNSEGAVNPQSQYGGYQSLLSQQESELSSAQEAAQQRHLGGAGLANQGETALKYQHGAQNTQFQQNVADTGYAYTSGSQAALAARNQAIIDAQMQAVAAGGHVSGNAVSTAPVPTAGPTPTGGTPPPAPGPPSAGSHLPAGTLPAASPANARTVWDVNDPSTYWGVNSASQGGAGLVLAPDADPDVALKYQAAVQAGVPVSIAINADANDTPETIAAKIAAAKKQYPGASFTLDLESPQFRGGSGSANWNQQQAFADAAIAAAGGTPINVTTEGVSDFNYGAWNQAGTTFSPQAYWGDMSPRDVQEMVNILLAQGIPMDQIIPLIAPGQDLGGYTGAYSIYGVPTNATGTAASPAPGNTVQSGAPVTTGRTPTVAGTPAQLYEAGYDPWAIAAINAARQPAPGPTPLSTLAHNLVYSRSRTMAV